MAGRGEPEESDRRGGAICGGSMRNKWQHLSLVGSPVPLAAWYCECFAFVLSSVLSFGPRLPPPSGAHGMFVDSSPPITPGHRAGCFLFLMPAVPPWSRPLFADIAGRALPIPLAPSGEGRQDEHPGRPNTHMGDDRSLPRPAVAL